MSERMMVRELEAELRQFGEISYGEYRGWGYTVLIGRYAPIWINRHSGARDDAAARCLIACLRMEGKEEDHGTSK